MATLQPKKISLADGSEIQLRSPTADDASEVGLFIDAIIANGAGMVAVTGEIPTDPDSQAPYIEKFLEDPLSIMITAFDNKSVVGHLNFRAQKRQRLKHGGEFGISIAPLWRGRGLGKILLERLIDWAQSSPITKVGLRTRSDNLHAIALYKKCGFQEQGRLIKEIRLEDGSYLDDILMYIITEE